MRAHNKVGSKLFHTLDGKLACAAFKAVGGSRRCNLRAPEFHIKAHKKAQKAVAVGIYYRLAHKPFELGEHGVAAVGIKLCFNALNQVAVKLFESCCNRAHRRYVSHSRFHIGEQHDRFFHIKLPR